MKYNSAISTTGASNLIKLLTNFLTEFIVRLGIRRLQDGVPIKILEKTDGRDFDAVGGQDADTDGHHGYSAE